MVLQGLVDIVEGYGGEKRLIAAHGPGRFLGELNLLTGQTLLFTAVVRQPREVLVVAAQRPSEVIAEDSTLGDAAGTARFETTIASVSSWYSRTGS